MARAADAVTLVAAALFVALVVSWLSYVASRASDAVEDDPYRAAEPELSRAVPLTITVLFAVDVVAMVVLSALEPSG